MVRLKMVRGSSKLADNDTKNGASNVEIYTPPNKLMEAIGNGSGPALREMQQEAERRLSATVAGFEDVLHETIARMKLILQSDGDAKSKHTKLFAEAHDIKGQASTFGYPLVSQVAQSICTAISDVPKKLSDQPDLLELHVNAISWAFANQHDDTKMVEKDALINSLHDALSK